MNDTGSRKDRFIMYKKWSINLKYIIWHWCSYV